MGFYVKSQIMPPAIAGTRAIARKLCTGMNSANFHTGRGYGGTCSEFSPAFSLEEIPTKGRGSSLGCDFVLHLQDVFVFNSVSKVKYCYCGCARHNRGINHDGTDAADDLRCRSCLRNKS